MKLKGTPEERRKILQEHRISGWPTTILPIENDYVMQAEEDEKLIDVFIKGVNTYTKLVVLASVKDIEGHYWGKINIPVSNAGDVRIFKGEKYFFDVVETTIGLKQPDGTYIKRSVRITNNFRLLA